MSALNTLNYRFIRTIWNDAPFLIEELSTAALQNRAEKNCYSPWAGW